MWLMHEALFQTMSEIQKNMQCDLLFDGLKSIKYNSCDSEELMVIHRLTLSQFFDLCSRLYCQGKRERENWVT